MYSYEGRTLEGVDTVVSFTPEWAVASIETELNSERLELVSIVDIEVV